MLFHADFRFCLRVLTLLPCVFRTTSSHAIQRRGLGLLILPLGDSITFGTDSSDGNGYRQDLQTLLEPTNNVEYIGSVKAGTMANNQNEGHPGFTITQIAAEAPQDFAQSPNVVLLMAGTNDINQNLSLADAPARLGALIDQLTGNLTQSTILVATLTPLLKPVSETARETYNSAIPGLIDERAKAGKRVMMVDMGNVTDDQINAQDGIHPDDDGYKTMATAWNAAILAAAGKGLIVNATVAGGSSGISANSSKFPSSTTLSSLSGSSLATSLSIPTLSLCITFGFMALLSL